MDLRFTPRLFANTLAVLVALYFASLLAVDLALRTPLDTNMILVIGAAGFLASMGLLLIPVGLRTNIGLLAVSLLGILLVVEFVLALKAFLAPGAVLAEEGRAVDARSKLEVVVESQRSGAPLLPFVPPADMLGGPDRTESTIVLAGEETFPLSQVSNREIVVCNEVGVWEVFPSDEHGFTNPRGLWSSAPVDVVAIGDSYTQGFCVPHGSDMVSVIRETFPATVNLAQGSTGPLMQLATLREYGPTLQPHSVVWFYYEGNDLRDLAHESSVPILMRYMDPAFTQRLIERRPELDDAILAQIDTVQQQAELIQSAFLWRTHNILSLRYLRTMLGVRFDPGFDDQFPLYERIVREAKTLTESWGGNLVFVFLPDWPRYLSVQSSGSNVVERYRERVLSIVRDAGIPIVDVHEVFMATGEPRSMFPRPGEVHYGERGHGVAGRAVAEALTRP